MSFVSIAEAIEEIRAGRILVVVDDEDRENEGDLTIAAEKVTPEIINFMATHGRGLICLTLTPERCDYLRLPLMSPEYLQFRHRILRIDRCARRRHHRHLGGRPHAHHPAGHRPVPPGDLARPGHVFPCGPAKAGCWCAPARPKPLSTWRAWRDLPRRRDLRNHE